MASAKLTYHRNKLATDVTYKMKIRVKDLICKSFNKRGYKKSLTTHKILGCSYDDFKSHIESKWEPWMSWENYGKFNGERNSGWDYDHIIPTSSAKTKPDIVKLNHHTNIQPLCSYINRRIKNRNIDPLIGY